MATIRHLIMELFVMQVVIHDAHDLTLPEDVQNVLAPEQSFGSNLREREAHFTPPTTSHS